MTLETQTYLYVDPSISVVIATSGKRPTVGENYTLSCDLVGADELTDRMVSYQWMRNETFNIETNLRELTFSPFMLSDAGNYSCQIRLESPLLSSGMSFAENSTIIYASSK